MIFYGHRISHCGYTMFSLSIPLSGHLDCFHDLAIVNSTTVNTGVCVPFQINALFLGDPLLWPLDLILHHSVQRSTSTCAQPNPWTLCQNMYFYLLNLNLQDYRLGVFGYKNLIIYSKVLELLSRIQTEWTVCIDSASAPPPLCPRSSAFWMPSSFQTAPAKSYPFFEKRTHCMPGSG